MTRPGSTGDVLLVRVGTRSAGGVRHPSAPLPPFGLKYLQALLHRHGRRAILRDGLIEPAAVEPGALAQLVDQTPIDAAVVDAQYGALDVAVGLARTLRAAGLEVLYLAGGHPAVHGDVGREIPPFRSVVGIEPELALSRVLIGHETSAKDLPIPRYTPDELRGYRHNYLLRLAGRVRYGHVLAGRGCPHRCAFCTAVLRTTHGTRLRMRDVASVLEEIELRRREGANVILFGDDDLTADRAFVGELCERLATRKSTMPFVAHARVDGLDAAQIRRLARAGCEMLLFGVESAAPAVLATLRKTPRPESWAPRAVEVFDRCRGEGIRTHAMFILGTPGESAADVRESLQLVRRLRPDSLQVHFFTPYPGVAVPGAPERPEHALAHYETPAKQRVGLSGPVLHAWRREFYRAPVAHPRWWARQLRELTPFLAYNPDIALALAQGLGRLTARLR